MAGEKAGAWKDAREAKDADYIQWRVPGTYIAGMLRQIRDGRKDASGNAPHYADIYVGNNRTVACSLPSVLYSRLMNEKALGCGVRIEFTGQDAGGSGKSGVKRFDVLVMPPSTDLRALPPDTWGVHEPTGSQVPGAVAAATDDDDLPF